MTRADHCQDCKGGGLVPGSRCTCADNVHTCTPVVCCVCDGTGTMTEVRARYVPDGTVR
jgi:DnaJ-class molecular chaperone